MENINEFNYPAKLMFQADDQWCYGREPLLRRMKDGSLVASIYSGGPYEPHIDNKVLFIRSEDNGNTWSKPIVLFSHPRRAVMPTEIFTYGENPILFFSTFLPEHNYREISSFNSLSDDNGRSWSNPVQVNGCGSYAVREGMVLEDGTWLFPVHWMEVREGWNWDENNKSSITKKWMYCSGVIRTNNKGKEFQKYGYIHLPDYRYHLWEPACVALTGQHLVMLMRAEGTGWLYRSDSYDAGLSWTAPEQTEIPNPASKFCLKKVGDTILLINNFNNLHDSNKGFVNRNHMEIWASKDNLLSFYKKTAICQREACIFYPHGFIENDILYLAVENGVSHYFLTIPVDDLI
ncbi:MAG: sialidase family protein [Clostridiaceae bacterium]|nr:sialidase family protein [Clostridiaceae bacterium]